MSKHTPGPWILFGANRIQFPMKASDCSQGTWHYSPQCNTGSFWIDTAAQIELEANARLIAVAPEMLKYLKKVAASMGLSNDDQDEIEALIAKAEGNENE